MQTLYCIAKTMNSNYSMYFDGSVSSEDSIRHRTKLKNDHERGTDEGKKRDFHIIFQVTSRNFMEILRKTRKNTLHYVSE
jgi:hypothetical protein